MYHYHPPISQREFRMQRIPALMPASASYVDIWKLTRECQAVLRAEVRPDVCRATTLDVGIIAPSELVSIQKC